MGKPTFWVLLFKLVMGFYLVFKGLQNPSQDFGFGDDFLTFLRFWETGAKFWGFIQKSNSGVLLSFQRASKPQSKFWIWRQFFDISEILGSRSRENIVFH